MKITLNTQISFAGGKGIPGESIQGTYKAQKNKC